MMHDIQHDTTANRFSMMIEGHRCVLDYVLTNQTMTITHTGVPEALGGRGLAGEITRFAIEFAKQQGWKSYPAAVTQRFTSSDTQNMPDWWHKSPSKRTNPSYI